MITHKKSQLTSKREKGAVYFATKHEGPWFGTRGLGYLKKLIPTCQQFHEVFIKESHNTKYLSNTLIEISGRQFTEK